MADKKHSTSTPKPLHTIRVGEVTILITERQTNAGFRYKVFTPTREWVHLGTGRRSHGSPVFAEQHEDDLVKAIREAAAWLRGEQPAPSTEDAGQLEDSEYESRRSQYELENPTGGNHG